VTPLREEPSGPHTGAGRLFRVLSRSQRGAVPALGALLASLLLVLAAYAGAIHGPAPSARTASARGKAGSGGVRLGGHAVGLYPGSVGRLRIHVDNLGAHAVTVRSIETEVGDATRRCSARNVSISSYRNRFRLRPHHRRWVYLKIIMRPDAANACQRARFPLAYRARVSE